MKLSVIIVNYNVEHFLEQCLHSVVKALKNIPAEIFVVDNNSVDGSVRMVKEKFPQATLLVNTRNTGFSHANNQALRLSAGEYVLLLNPDTIVAEDTFVKTLHFLDEHREAGALGVKMLDGKGNFLPESKRGFPSPAVAFYKIFGLSALFPRSRVFGRYHLGYLDNNHIHEVEVLSGAFMMIRRTVLDRVGLLDEDFFMYGEDIDFSYRVKKVGYKNYYFPETNIIHYKGESTRKSSVNYVFTFYKAMIIFARKHFSGNNAALFIFLINLAVYLRAGAALGLRFAKKIMLPLADFILLYGGIYYITLYYERHVKFQEGGSYPAEFISLVIPSYILTWLFTVFLSGGYEKPVRLLKIIKGIAIGTGIILVIYALLPETLRFSRALILAGAGWSSLALILFRVALHALHTEGYNLANGQHKRILILGSAEECTRVVKLLKETSLRSEFIGFINPGEAGAESKNGFLGTLSQLTEIIKVYMIDELIFCARDIQAQQIINLMAGLGEYNVDYKIAPPESLSVIGSNSINTSGDLYVIGTNSITREINRRNKRLLDILASFCLLIFFPVLLFIVKNPLQFLKNIFLVATGLSSWVGYHPSAAAPDGKGAGDMPAIRRGVLYPTDILRDQELSRETILRSNLKYVKDYDVWNDFLIILKNIGLLGRK